eukprot:TRINITY_DN11778_c0_g1_i1.p1 TRINITY_DN11778_c0_g1~~TRINITY_DN11778_c0_g1_i1.p1  ORF type:complete len:137 (+),score=15.29 TRINITY_DN11778_c0_g1_i1:74-484(+)
MGRQMYKFIGSRIKARVGDYRVFEGTLQAFDPHMNLVLADCEETRTIRKKKGKKETTEKHHLGLVILRGMVVSSIIVENFSENQATDRFAMDDTAKENLGLAVSSSTAPAPKMSAPAQGVGAPAADDMQPQVKRRK